MMFLPSSNKIIIWKKPNNTYYYKIIKGHYIPYEVGYKNSYGHEIVLIISNLEYRVRKTPIKKRIKRKLIDYIDNNLWFCVYIQFSCLTLIL